MLAGSLQNPSRSYLFEIAALVVVIILVFWFLLKPKQSNLNELRRQIKTQQASYKQIDETNKEIEALISRLKQSDKEVALVDEALPLDVRVTKVNLLIDNLVSASGMDIISLNSQNLDIAQAGQKQVIENPFGVNRAVQVTNIDLTTTGTVDQFKNLLELIETNGRVMDIMSLEISGQDDNTPAFRIKLKAYSYVP